MVSPNCRSVNSGLCVWQNRKWQINGTGRFFFIKIEFKFFFINNFQTCLNNMGWIRIWNFKNSKLDPDPESIIPNPQHCKKVQFFSFTSSVLRQQRLVLASDKFLTAEIGDSKLQCTPTMTQQFTKTLSPFCTLSFVKNQTFLILKHFLQLEPEK